MPDGRLYETDWYAWTREQAATLRRMAETRVDTELDLDHLAEEIEALGRSEAAALESDLVRIIEHLLKLEHSPAGDPRKKWVLSVAEHRDRVLACLEDSGTLTRKVPDLLPRAWRRARRQAAIALELNDGLSPDTLPDDCPYTLEHILDERFFPASRHGL